MRKLINIITGAIAGLMGAMRRENIVDEIRREREALKSGVLLPRDRGRDD